MYYYIVNPAAGSGRANRIQEELRSMLRELGISGEFVKTLGQDDVTALTRAGLDQGATTIVAVGGDSTASEIMRALYGVEGVALGIVPVGHRNHLASLLGIPDWRSAPQILAARKIEPVDLGEIGGRYFVGSVGIGFEAAFPHIERMRYGGSLTRLRLLPSYLSAIRRFPRTEVALHLDGQALLRAPGFNITVANSRSNSEFGLAFSNPQDRRLDVTLISDIRPSLVLRQLPQYLSGRLREISEMSLFRAGKIDVQSTEPLPVHVDGEAVGTTPVTVRVADHPLQLIVGRERQF